MLVTKEIETPVGIMIAGVSGDKLRVFEFTEPERLARQHAHLENSEPGDNPLFKELERQLQLYFEAKLTKFDIPLQPTGTPFQQRVWDALQSIPFGETRSYGDLASSLGDRGCVRAVGRANGSNPIAILIPCHRVIATNGTLCGYGGGLWRKEKLLTLEGKQLGLLDLGI